MKTEDKEESELSDFSTQALGVIGLNVKDHLLLEVAETGSARLHTDMGAL